MPPVTRVDRTGVGERHTQGDGYVEVQHAASQAGQRAAIEDTAGGDERDGRHAEAEPAEEGVEQGLRRVRGRR